MSDESRTVFCGNIAERVTEELLYELFLQVAPLDRVRIPNDKEGRRSNFGFVTFKHEVSVEYAVQMLNGTSLFDRRLNVKPRNSNQQQSRQEHHYPPAPTMEQYPSFQELLQMGTMMRLAPRDNGGTPVHGSDLRYGHGYDRHRSDPRGYRNRRQDDYYNDNQRNSRNNYQRSNNRSYDRNKRQRPY